MFQTFWRVGCFFSYGKGRRKRDEKLGVWHRNGLKTIQRLVQFDSCFECTRNLFMVEIFLNVLNNQRRNTVKLFVNVFLHFCQWRANVLSYCVLIRLKWIRIMTRTHSNGLARIELIARMDARAFSFRFFIYIFISCLLSVFLCVRFSNMTFRRKGECSRKSHSVEFFS